MCVCVAVCTGWKIKFAAHTNANICIHPFTPKKNRPQSISIKFTRSYAPVCQRPIIIIHHLLQTDFAIIIGKARQIAVKEIIRARAPSCTQASVFLCVCVWVIEKEMCLNDWRTEKCYIHRKEKINSSCHLIVLYHLAFCRMLEWKLENIGRRRRREQGIDSVCVCVSVYM